jgi:hypothetical protein
MPISMLAQGAPLAAMFVCGICCAWVFVLPLGLLATAFWIWMLIDAIKRCPNADNLKLIWVLVIVFTHFVGAVIYYFVQRPKNPTVV